MGEFQFIKHSVKKAAYCENENQVDNKLAIRIDGRSVIPKDLKDNNRVVVQLDFSLGSEETSLLLKLQTLTMFAVIDSEDEIDDENVKRECLPIALDQLRETVRNVTEACGRQPIEIPPFDTGDFDVV